jgi:hypothetical protein
MVIRSPHRPRGAPHDRVISQRPRALASWLAEQGELVRGSGTVSLSGMGPCQGSRSWRATDFNNGSTCRLPLDKDIGNCSVGH